MNRGFAASVVLLVLINVGPARGQTGPYDLPPGYQQREVHDPASPRYINRRGAGFSTSGSSFGFFSAPGGSLSFGSGLVPVPVPAPGWGWYPPYEYYPPYYDPPYPAYPYYADPPPLFIPAATMYGPGAVWRMFNGVPFGSTSSTVAIATASRPVQPALVENAPRRKASSTDTVRARAKRYADAGDEAFQEQKYALALARYRRAAEVASDLAEWRFREGQALVALGRYADAAESFKRALAMDPLAPQIPLRLDALYGPNLVAKASHLEALAQAATEQPQDADLLFLVGAELFMDGQRARSLKFFQRADQLALGLNEHLQAFLKVLPAEERVVQEDAVAGRENAVDL